MKTSYKLVTILIAAILGLIVGDYLGPVNGLLIHWDMYIPYYVSVYLKIFDVLISALSLTVFLIIPIKYYRYPIWLVVVLTFGSIFLSYIFESINLGCFLSLYAIQKFFYNLVPLSIGVFSVIGLWYFIVENFIKKKSNSVQ